MKIILTGASGFIGRHVLPFLLNEGYDVICVVRDKTALLNFQEQCQIIEYNIGSDVSTIYKDLGHADVLIHLAWGGLSNYRSLLHFEFELTTHYDFVKSMVNAGIKHVFVTGTCFEYGMQSGQLSEKIKTQPTTSYGFAKDTLRKQLNFMKGEYDFNLTWIRLFYMYGDDQPQNTLYSQLRTAVDKGEPVFNMSGGEQLRDYLHIDEVARRIVRLVSRTENIGPVNICSGNPISVRRLVEQWIESNNWDVSINLGFYPYPDYEPFAFWGDNSKYQLLSGEINGT